MHAGYAGKIQVMKKEVITIKAILLSYPCTIRIDKQLSVPCNLANLKQFTKINWC